jgi:cytochrome c-type biogenesis protein CcmH/NrfG
VNEQEQQLPTQAKRFPEAEAALMPNGELPDNPRELDLLARIAAQRDRLSDARRLWETALQKDPRNPEYEGCLQRLAQALHRETRFGARERNGQKRLRERTERLKR